MTTASPGRQQVSTARSRVNTDGLETDRFGRLRGIVDISFLDKPWMASRPRPRGPRPGRHLRHLHRLRHQLRDPLHRRDPQPPAHRDAHDHRAGRPRRTAGETWSDPVAVSPTVRRAYGEQGDPSGAAGVFGTLRVVQGSAARRGAGRHRPRGLDGQHRRRLPEGRRARSTSASSTDGGRTCDDARSSPRSSTRSSSGRARAFFRFWASAFPQLAVGPDGELYIVYVGRPSDKPNDDGDIFLVSSFDDGRHLEPADASSTTTTPTTSSSSPRSTSTRTAPSTSCGATCATTRTRPATTSTTRARTTRARRSASSTRSSTSAPATPA